MFTTRPDTLFGASFCAISPDHPLADEIGRGNPDIVEFIAECRRTGTSEAVIETQEKRGIDTGLRAVHPLDPSISVPVYVANFVLMEYGTGAIFGCPAHDASATWSSPAPMACRCPRWCCRPARTRPDGAIADRGPC